MVFWTGFVLFCAKNDEFDRARQRPTAQRCTSYNHPPPRGPLFKDKARNSFETEQTVFGVYI